VTLDIPPIEQMIEQLPAVEHMLPSRWRFHYSNLAFGLLGEVVARLAGQPWETAESADRRPGRVGGAGRPLVVRGDRVQLHGRVPDRVGS